MFKYLNKHRSTNIYMSIFISCQSQRAMTILDSSAYLEVQNNKREKGRSAVAQQLRILQLKSVQEEAKSTNTPQFYLMLNQETTE